MPTTAFVRPTIAAMAGYAPGEQPDRGGRVIKLNTNENPYPPSDKVLATIAATDAEMLRRYPDPLANDFRDVAANRHGVTRDQILVGNGSDDLLTIAVRTFVPAGGIIAYPDPTYSLYPILAKLQDAQVVEVPWDAEWSLPTNALAAAKPRLTFLANPNSPSGTLIGTDAVADLARKLDGVLLIDEAYADFAGEDCIKLASECDNVVVSRTLSKGFSLAGLRLGYAVASERLIREMLKVKDSYNVDAISIAAATAALQDEQHAAKSWRAVADARESLTAELTDLGFDVLPSRANFVLATPPNGEAGRLYEGLKEQGVLVRWFNTPGLADKLRITVGTPTENAALIEACRSLVPGEVIS